MHLLQKTSYLWILAVGTYRFSSVSFSLHKDQDQINSHSLSLEQRYTSDLSVTKDLARHQLFCSDSSRKKRVTGIFIIQDLIPPYLMVIGIHILIRLKGNEVNG